MIGLQNKVRLEILAETGACSGLLFVGTEFHAGGPATEVLSTTHSRFHGPKLHVPPQSSSYDGRDFLRAKAQHSSSTLSLTSGYATWFTAEGALRIGHYDVIDDVITQKL